jgi:phospholipid/cholesterol/gamma-HCH transport system substrate-binding protein
MPKDHSNDLKLGIFLITGLLVLVFALYMIGKDQSMFTSSFKLRARFRDVAGLMPGNNVRYSGIQNGTVKAVQIVDDTTIEVIMFIDKATRAHNRKNSVASIGSEGLMGNKVVNIMPGDISAPLAEEGDVLPTTMQASLGAAMGTLYRTNDNAAIIAEELVHTVRSINNSPFLRVLLTDSSIPQDIHATLANISAASIRINHAASGLDAVVADVRSGKGTIGLLTANNEVREKALATVTNLHQASDNANQMIGKIDSIAAVVQTSMSGNAGGLYVLLRDTSFVGKLSRSMQSVESGTASFSEDMEALKHNFLTRGYFRRLEKKRRSKE